MTTHNAGRLIAEKLKMSDTTGQHVVLCPFHPNTETPSLSLDLDKGVFFCHSACDEPKGGGVVEFLVKWAKIVDQKPITKQEARRKLHRSFSIPNAKQLRDARETKELRLFARLMLHVFGNTLKQIERSLLYSRKMKWLKIDCQLHALIEWCFDVCLASNPNPTSELSAVLATAKAHGWWNYAEARTHALHSRRYVRTLRVLERQKTRRTVDRTPVLPEKGDLCRAIPLSPKRQPVSSVQTETTRMSMKTTRRQPIP